MAGKQMLLLCPLSFIYMKNSNREMKENGM
jgi:hypothetical protein